MSRSTILANGVLKALCIAVTTTPLAAQEPPAVPADQQVKQLPRQTLSGPRFGFTTFTGEVADMREVMAKAGATHVVVMARAHEETIRCVVQAGRDFGIQVMGDNLACDDMVGGARRLEDLGCDYVIHHIGYDERRGIAARGQRMPSPLDQLREVVAAVSVPVQAVGGLTLEQAVRAPEYGAPLVVLGAPLVIDADAFKTASGDLEDSLRMICEKVHGYGDIPVGGHIS